MLDPLVDEARDRWGLDVSTGLQVVAAERLIATPIEASRPLLIVPMAAVRQRQDPGAAASDASADPDAPADAAALSDSSAPAEPLAGRHGPRGRDPLQVLLRL